MDRSFEKKARATWPFSISLLQGDFTGDFTSVIAGFAVVFGMGFRVGLVTGGGLATRPQCDRDRRCRFQSTRLYGLLRPPRRGEAFYQKVD